MLRLDRRGRKSYSRGMHSTITEKGQVTIPKHLRQRMGMKPGQKVVFEEQAGGVMLRAVVDKDPLRDLLGLVKESFDVDQYLVETRGPAWDPELDPEEL